MILTILKSYLQFAQNKNGMEMVWVTLLRTILASSA